MNPLIGGPPNAASTSPAVATRIRRRLGSAIQMATGSPEYPGCTMKWWLDGVLQGSYTNVTNSFNFDMFQFSPTWGGNIGAQKHETDHYWFDHVHLSVR